MRAYRILIVDDDVASVHATRSALAALGAAVMFATAADDALRIAREQEPDLILLDIQMPHMDGFAICRQLQSSQPQIPIIFLTHCDDPVYETKALAAGAVDFVTKPFSVSVLQARILKALRTEQRTRAAIQAERELWQKIGETRVAEIVACASDAFVTLDVEGRVVLMNHAACRICDMRAADAVGRPFESVLPPTLAENVDHAGVPEQRLLITRRDGTVLPVAMSRFSLGEGPHRLTTVVLRDVTVRDEAERAARARLAAESEARAKSLMLSYVAHEISAPLGVILGFAELLSTNQNDPLSARQAEQVSLIMTAAQHLKALMRDVLDVNALEAGRFAFTKDRLDVGGCMRKATLALSALAAQHGIEVRLTLPGDPLTVEADATRVQQCLLNLLSNAIKYNVEQGTVELTAREVDAQVRIEVRDRGLGMTEQQQQHLFEPFNRLGRTGSGNGIGLALTRQLVHGMGGRILVESASNVGSCFTIELPAWQGPP